MKNYNLTDWLPTTKKEVELRGWDELDVILFSGDAYVDHPSFGAAVIGRMLESQGLKVAIVPQPNWRDDLRDFKKLGRPRLFFGVSAGCMDSMVNKYTANKRLRSEDAYTPDGRHDMRPEYPSIVYTQILKQLYPDVPVILGGIEASLRRLTHYDYWQDKVRPSILLDSGADLLIYGMGEKPITDLCQRPLPGKRVPASGRRPAASFARGLSERQTEAGRKLPAHRRGIEQVPGRTHLSADRQTGSSSQSALSADEPGRTGPVVRPALHTPASSQIQEQTYSGVRDDQVLGEHSPRLFRRLRLLHHLGPSGKVHRQPKQGKHPKGSKSHHGNAGLQRLPE